jgi:hypothetical protein
MVALLARSARGDGAALALDAGEVAEGLERREPGGLGAHAGVDQLLGSHVEVEAQFGADVAGHVGGGTGQAEPAAHASGAQAGAASSAAVTARA